MKRIATEVTGFTNGVPEPGVNCER